MSSKLNDALKQQEHYSTFTNDLQAQRLAALKETAEEYKESSSNVATATDKISSWANSVSSGVSDFFHYLLFRTASACLPCFEIVSALNLLGSRRSAANEERAGIANTEVDTLMSDADSVKNNGCSVSFENV